MECCLSLGWWYRSYLVIDLYRRRTENLVHHTDKRTMGQDDAGLIIYKWDGSETFSKLGFALEADRPKVVIETSINGGISAFYAGGFCNHGLGACIPLTVSVVCKAGDWRRSGSLLILSQHIKYLSGCNALPFCRGMICDVVFKYLR